MAFGKSTSLIILLVLIASWFGVCFGTLYRVGDTNGWNNKTNIDYKTWASSKQFHVGDVILFEYDAREDNVVRVNHRNYRTCNVTDPISITDSGRDSISIKGPAHLFFISGLPGHCEAGQKVNIRVVQYPDSESMNPIPAPDSAETPTILPSPSPNNPKFPSSKAPLPQSDPQRRHGISCLLFLLGVMFF